MVAAIAIIHGAPDGKYYLSLEATDEVDLAIARLMNTTGTRILREASSFETNEEGNRVVTFDITGLGTEDPDPTRACCHLPRKRKSAYKRSR